MIESKKYTDTWDCVVNLNHFRLLRVVGKGAFGKVRIVERKDTGLTFALKYIRKDEGWHHRGRERLVTGGLYIGLKSSDRRACGTLSGSGGCWNNSTTRSYATCDTAFRTSNTCKSRRLLGLLDSKLIYGQVYRR